MQCRLSSIAPDLQVRPARSRQDLHHFTCQFVCAAQNDANLFSARAFSGTGSGKVYERSLAKDETAASPRPLPLRSRREPLRSRWNFGRPLARHEGEE